MKSVSVFPIHLYARDQGGWVESPPLAMAIWKRLRATSPKAKELSWYAVSAEIESPTSVTIHVFTMLDNFRGGIGRVIHKQTVEAEGKELDLIKKAIHSGQLEYARRTYWRLKAEREECEIEDLRIHLFDSHTRTE